MEVLENQHYTFDSDFTANISLMWGNYASIQLILLSSELVQLSVSGLTSPLAASRGIVIDAGPAQPSPSPVELFAGTAILCSNIVKQALTSVMKLLSTLSISVMNNLKASLLFYEVLVHINCQYNY